jgi:hypothetical protein
VIPAAALALALSVQPSPMRLGEDARAKVRIECAVEPAMAASVGRIEGLRRTGEASWEADYLPPDEELPQVALLTAVAAGEVAFAAVPLWASGDAVVKTRPGGRISVDIGSRTFGPVIADAKGQAVVPVLVPPGVKEARHGKRMIPLGLPPTRTVQAVFGDAVRTADRAQTVALYIVAVTPQGDPRSGATIHLRTSRGALSPVREIRPGLYQSSLSLSPSTPGTVRVTAALDDAPGFLAQAALSLGGGPADKIKLSADRERVEAREPQARLHASARDAAGNPPGEDLRFETGSGELQIKPAAPGEWDLTLTLPSSFGGSRSVEVLARGANASASKKLELAPGPPEMVVFESAKATVVADGESPLRLAVELRDRYGNAVLGIRPELSAQQGHAEIEERDGRLYASYVPPLLRERGETVLAVRAGAVVGSAHLTLLPERSPLAFSAKAGGFSNFSGFTAPLIGVEAALRTDILGPHLAFSLETDYAHRSQSDLVTTGTAQVLAGSRLDLLLVHASAAYRHVIGNQNTLWIAAGPSAAAYWTSVSAGSGGSRRGFAIAPGLQASLGAEHRFDRAVPFLEARAGWITSPGLPILTGPLRTLTLFAGVRLEMR